MGQTAAQEGIRNSGKDAHGSRAASTGWRSVDGNGYDNVVGGVSGRYIDRSPPVMEGREGSFMPSCPCSMSPGWLPLAEV
jgi:hypothetical protein